MIYMSDYGEEIIDSVNSISKLRDKNNPAYQIIDNTIGELLQQIDEKTFFEQFFLQEADGKYLDLHGQTYGVTRKIDESDDDYRERIVYITLGRLTITFLKEVYGVELYVNVDGFNQYANDLTSDNQYINVNGTGYMGIASETVKDILNNKFVIGGGIRWL